MSGSKEAESKKLELINQAIQKLDTSGFVFHKKSVSETYKELESSAKGLTSHEAKSRLEKFGPNELEEEAEESLWQKIME